MFVNVLTGLMCVYTIDNGIYQFVTHLLLCAFLFCMFVCFFIDMWSEVIYTHHLHGFHRNFGVFRME